MNEKLFLEFTIDKYGLQEVIQADSMNDIKIVDTLQARVYKRILKQLSVATRRFLEVFLPTVAKDTGAMRRFFAESVSVAGIPFKFLRMTFSYASFYRLEYAWEHIAGRRWIRTYHKPTTPYTYPISKEKLFQAFYMSFLLEFDP